MKSIIFDLDGTLWKTERSYIYAYHKLIDKYHLTNYVSDEEVKSFLGVKINDLLSTLFKGLANSKEIANDGVRFSIEYIKEHPEESIEKNLKEILIELMQKHDIYIVSNCPRSYVQTFLDIIGLALPCYTIEDGSKKENINKVLEKGTAIFIGDASSDYEAIEDHYKCKFVYAKYGYKEAHEYDYFINSIYEIIDVIKLEEEKEKMLWNKTYRVFSCNDSNLTFIRNNKNGSYYFGFVHFQDTEEDKIVIQKLTDEVNALKISIIGPIDGNTFYPYRFATDAFDYLLYPDCHNSEKTYRLFLESGFQIHQRYASTLASINEKVWNRAKKVHLKPNYRIKTVEGNEAYQYIDALYDVTIDAFTNGDYYEEISRENFKNIYLKNLALVRPDLVLIYDNDLLVGYNFCYEDLKKRFYVSKTIGIRKQYQNALIIMPLIDYSYQIMVKRGYKEVLYHFQNERTKVLVSIYKNHVIKQKHYALLRYDYEK